jgi:hypothetical protein
MLRDKILVCRQPIAPLNTMDRSNNILSGTGRRKYSLIGLVKAQSPQMAPQTFLESCLTRRNANDGLTLLSHSLPLQCALSSGLRYFIKCGATRLINSRGVMILVFFQNLGKCF